MKFLCANCKAKYQISDEKIAGRTLKMDCRRCNHPIVIRGDRRSSAGPAPSPRAGASRRGPAGPSPSRSSARGTLGAEFRKNVKDAPAPERTSALDQWHVAINDVPVGPMKRGEIANKIASGAVTKGSLCWREGLDDWRELGSIPELAGLLRRAAAPPRPKQPAFPPPPGRGLGHGPGRRPPTGRTAAPSPRREASRPAARGNVVPIGGRLGAAAAPAAFDEDLDDEPTRVGTALDFEKMQAEHDREEARNAEADRAAEDARRAEEAARRAEEDARRAQEDARRAEEEARQAEAAFAARGANAEIVEDDSFDPFASQRNLPVVSPAPVAPAHITGGHAVPERRRRAIPIGAWIAIAGAVSFGMVLAVMVGMKLLFPTPPAAAVATTQPTPPAPEPQEAALEPPAPIAPTPIEDTETETGTAPEPVEQVVEVVEPHRGAQAGAQAASEHTGRRRAAPTGPRSAIDDAVGVGGSGTSASGGGGSRRGSSQMDEATRRRLAQMAGDNAAGPSLDISRPRSTLEEDRDQASSELTADQIRAVVRRGRTSVQRCYETAARQAGNAPAIRINVAVTVSGSGRVTTARATGENFGTIHNCIERSVQRWSFPRTGAVSNVSIPFVFTGRE